LRGINLDLPLPSAIDWERDRRRFQAIAAAGFTWVRIVIPGSPVNTAGLDEDTLARLDHLLNLVAENHLTAVVSPYPVDPLDPPTAPISQERLWTLLAAHLASRSADRVCFELCNDPNLDAQQWNLQIPPLVDVIRRIAPQQTIIVDAPMGLGRSVEALDDLAPLAANRIVYAVRFFDPLVFTSQGATWLGDAYDVATVPYPNVPGNAPGDVPGDLPGAQARTEAGRRALAAYARERWDGQRIDGLMAQAAAWSIRHRAPVLVANFGAVSEAPRQARLAWMTDVRAACVRHGLGWAIWKGTFGVWQPPYPASSTFDPQALQALGLQESGR